MKDIKRRIRHLHRKHKLHHRTIFYMRKGRRIHFHRKIISESLKMLIIASAVSTIGGIGLQSLEQKLVTLLPLLILLPALNHMVGSYGTIISSRFTADLYMGRISRNWWKSPAVKMLLKSVLLIAFITSLYVAALSSAVSLYSGFEVTAMLFSRTMLISAAVTMAFVLVIFFITVLSGLYIYSKKKDPNNFLIPLTTSIADLGSITVFSLMMAYLL